MKIRNKNRWISLGLLKSPAKISLTHSLTRAHSVTVLKKVKMAAVVDDNNQATPIGAPKSGSPSASASPPNPNNSNNKNGTSSSSKDHILSVASKIASQPLQFSDPNVWAVLTAISANARKRHQVSLSLSFS